MSDKNRNIRKNRINKKGKKEDSRRTPTEQIRVRGIEDIREINTSDYELLRKLMTEHGRIMPARFSGLTAKQQRKVKRAIKRARTMGLLP